jgi:hypothetical protein
MKFNKTLSSLVITSSIVLGTLSLPGCSDAKSEEFESQGSGYEQSDTPEPSTIALLSTGALALGAYAYNSYRKKSSK